MARVCQLTDDLKYYLCMEPVDMRKQFQGLQGIVNEEFGRYLTQDEALLDKEDEAGWSSNGSRHHVLRQAWNRIFRNIAQCLEC